MALIEEPLLTFELDDSSFVPEAGSAYLYGSADEDRAIIDDAWARRASANGVSFIALSDASADVVAVRPHGAAEAILLSLRSVRQIREFLDGLPERVYIDVTGLAHSVWAVMLREAIQLRKRHAIVYTEPTDYRKDSSPAQGMVYDLSERISGIAPLPGFARFTGPDSQGGNVVALLGFEGARLAFLLDTLEVSFDSVVPIVGVPGFALHHPFESIDGNSESLRREFMHSRLMVAKANCPFDAFHQIYRAFRDGEWDYGRVAPIGTKPHGVGAVLFALSRPALAELVYDHPVRKAKRSVGKGRVCLYDTAAFCESDLFLSQGEYSTVRT